MLHNIKIDMPGIYFKEYIRAFLFHLILNTILSPVKEGTILNFNVE
jgi:hypothetical protein